MRRLLGGDQTATQDKPAAASPTPAAPGAAPTPTVPKPDQGGGGGPFSWLGKAATGLAKGVADIALQPARFLERAGKQVGEIGLTPEQKAKTEAFMGPGIQERIMGKDYATPAYKNAEETAGGALQAGANLATPLIGAGGIPALAAQGAAASAGRAMEQDKGAASVVGEGALGSVIGAGTGFLMKGVGKIMQGTTDQIVEKLGQAGRGLTDAEVGTIKAVPDIVKDYHGTLTAAGDDLVKQQAARQGIEDDIFDTARNAWNEYSGKAAQQYEADMAEHAANVLPDAAPLAKSDLIGGLKDLADSRGIDATVENGKLTGSEGATETERAMLQKLFNKVGKASGDPESVVGDLSWDNLNSLRKDVGQLYDSAKPGTPEKSILDSFYGNLKTRMMDMSSDPEAVQATFDDYHNFLSEKSAFKTLTSNKSDPAAVKRGYLEIARALSGQKGSGGMSEAMSEAEKAAGLKPGELAYRLQALQLASKLAGVRDVSTTEKMIAGGAEEAMRGKLPTSLVDLGAKALQFGAKKVTDKAFMKQIFEQSGTKVSQPIIAKIGQLLESEGGANVLSALVQAVQNDASRGAGQQSVAPLRPTRRHL